MVSRKLCASDARGSSHSSMQCTSVITRASCGLCLRRSCLCLRCCEHGLSNGCRASSCSCNGSRRADDFDHGASSGPGRDSRRAASRGRIRGQRGELAASDLGRNLGQGAGARGSRAHGRGVCADGGEHELTIASIRAGHRLAIAHLDIFATPVAPGRCAVPESRPMVCYKSANGGLMVAVTPLGGALQPFNAFDGCMLMCDCVGRARVRVVEESWSPRSFRSGSEAAPSAWRVG